jgi:hypothetical protein
MMLHQVIHEEKLQIEPIRQPFGPGLTRNGAQVGTIALKQFDPLPIQSTPWLSRFKHQTAMSRVAIIILRRGFFIGGMQIIRAYGV